MILPIAPLGQRDPRWASQRLGTVNGTTIGSDGCVITSASMMYTYYGKNTTPDVLDNFLTENRLYASGNLWIPTNVGKWLNGVAYQKMVDCSTTPAPIAAIKEHLDSKRPLFVWGMNQGVRHCTLAIGYDGDKIIVNDPWSNRQGTVESIFGKTSAQWIISVDWYTGPVPVTTNPTPPMSEQDKKDIESMRKLRAFNSVWYEAQDVLRDWSTLEKRVKDVSNENDTLKKKLQGIQKALQNVLLLF